MQKPNYSYFLITLFFLLVNSNSSYAQFESWEKGHYYTWNDEKVVGDLKHTYYGHIGSEPDNELRFRTGKKAKRITLTTKEVKSFVLQKDSVTLDSFIVLKNFSTSFWNPFKEDFVQVVASGTLNLYKHYSSISDGKSSSKIDTWIVQKGDLLIPINNQSEFRERMPKLVSDDAELVEKIKNKKFKSSDMEEVLKLYNQRHLTSLN